MNVAVEESDGTGISPHMLVRATTWSRESVPADAVTASEDMAFGEPADIVIRSVRSINAVFSRIFRAGLLMSDYQGMIYGNRG